MKLLHEIEMNKIFDIEDKDIIKTIIDVDIHISQIKHIINQDMSKTMKERIDARSNLSEQHELVLEKCPEILEYFAIKQLLLQSEIGEKMQLLAGTSS